ncbi:phosphoribosylanthranilate isomerase [Maribacter chungangensis]|uniref:N-(5'-phosphoribosyl)anthranilate isomerase n=1 Tax=Maribacter chungangensis TaxID=1069117 RepID=A0ABW3B4X0_9FLAO
MKYNPEAVAALRPDYLGFIFWEPSSRFFSGEIPSLPKEIKKIGVFVDATITDVTATIEKYNLDGVQLHGNESPDYCLKLRPVRFSKPHRSIEIIKVFSIKDEFDFSLLRPFENVCDYFLFDTKGKLPGGNGYAFDWSVLKAYPYTKPYFLSGGIGLENKNDITEFLKRPESKYCHAIDVNSKFEQEPGLKKIAELKEFINVVSKL